MPPHAVDRCPYEPDPEGSPAATARLSLAVVVGGAGARHGGDRSRGHAVSGTPGRWTGRPRDVGRRGPADGSGGVAEARPDRVSGRRRSRRRPRSADGTRQGRIPLAGKSGEVDGSGTAPGWLHDDGRRGRTLRRPGRAALRGTLETGIRVVFAFGDAADRTTRMSPDRPPLPAMEVCLPGAEQALAEPDGTNRASASPASGTVHTATPRLPERGIRLGLGLGTVATRHDGVRLLDAAETARRLTFSLAIDDFGVGRTWVHAATRRTGRGHGRAGTRQGGPLPGPGPGRLRDGPGQGLRLVPRALSRPYDDPGGVRRRHLRPGPPGPRPVRRRPVLRRGRDPRQDRCGRRVGVQDPLSLGARPQHAAPPVMTTAQMMTIVRTFGASWPTGPKRHRGGH